MKHASRGRFRPRRRPRPRMFSIRHVHKLSQIRIRQPTPITPNALGNLEDEDDDEDEYDAFSTTDALPDVCETH
jgi:hypothetical protein